MEVLEWAAARPAEFWLLPPAIVIAAIFGIAMLRRRLLLNRWREIAGRTGLELRARYYLDPEVSGTYRGRSLTMTPSGRARRGATFHKRWTRVIVSLNNPHCIGLKIYRQDVLDTLLTKVGYPDVRVGDDAFDRRFLIQTREVDITKKLLQDPVLRQDLLAPNIEMIEIFGNTMRGYYAREERDPAHAELLFTALTRLADAIDTVEWDYNRVEIV